MLIIVRHKNYIEGMLKVIFYSVVMLLMGVKAYEMQETPEHSPIADNE